MAGVLFWALVGVGIVLAVTGSTSSKADLNDPSKLAQTIKAQLQQEFDQTGDGETADSVTCAPQGNHYFVCSTTNTTADGGADPATARFLVSPDGNSFSYAGPSD